MGDVKLVRRCKSSLRKIEVGDMNVGQCETIARWGLYSGRCELQCDIDPFS